MRERDVADDADPQELVSSLLRNGADPIKPVENKAVASLMVAGGRPEWQDERVPIHERAGDFLNTYSNASERENRAWPSAAAALQQRFPQVDPSGFQKAYEQKTGLQTERENFAEAEQTNKEAFIRHASSAQRTQNINQHREATERFNKGEATPEDLKNIAAFERMQEIDKRRGLAGDIGVGLLGIPEIAAQAYVAGKVLKPLSMIPGAGWLAPTATAAGELSTPLTAARALGATAGFAGRTLATTALMPSMYQEGAAQRALETGGKPTDLKNAAPAFALGALQTAVLGSLQEFGNLPGEGWAARAKRIAAKTALGLPEQQAADLLAGATGLQTGYGVLGDLADGKGGDALKHATVQAVTFGVFAAMHSGEPQTVFTTYQKHLDQLRKRGFSSDGAGNVLGSAFDTIEQTYKTNPQATPAEVGKAVEAMPEGPAKTFAKDLAAKLPEVKAEEAKPAEAKPEPTGEETPEQHAAQIEKEHGPEAAQKFLAEVQQHLAKPEEPAPAPETPTGGTPPPEPGTGLINPVQSGVPGIVSGAVEVPEKEPANYRHDDRSSNLKRRTVLEQAGYSKKQVASMDQRSLEDHLFFANALKDQDYDQRVSSPTDAAAHAEKAEKEKELTAIQRSRGLMLPEKAPKWRQDLPERRNSDHEYLEARANDLFDWAKSEGMSKSEAVAALRQEIEGGFTRQEEHPNLYTPDLLRHLEAQGFAKAPFDHLDADHIRQISKQLTGKELSTAAGLAKALKKRGSSEEAIQRLSEATEKPPEAAQQPQKAPQAVPAPEAAAGPVPAPQAPPEPPPGPEQPMPGFMRPRPAESPATVQPAKTSKEKRIEALRAAQVRKGFAVGVPDLPDSHLPPEQQLDSLVEQRGVTPREKMVMVHRASGESLEAIATDMGVSKERVRQLEESGLAKFGVDQGSLEKTVVKPGREDALRDAIAAGQEDYEHFDSETGRWVLEKVKKVERFEQHKASGDFDPETGERLPKGKVKAKDAFDKAQDKLDEIAQTLTRGWEEDENGRHPITVARIGELEAAANAAYRESQASPEPKQKQRHGERLLRGRVVEAPVRREAGAEVPSGGAKAPAAGQGDAGLAEGRSAGTPAVAGGGEAGGNQLTEEIPPATLALMAGDARGLEGKVVPNPMNRSEHHTALAEKMGKEIAAASIPEPLKREYARNFLGVLGRMSPDAARLASESVKKASFHASVQDLGESLAKRFTAAKAAIEDGQEIGGGYVAKTGEIILDGGGQKDVGAEGLGAESRVANPQQLYAHELGHAIDGPDKAISSSKEWIDAWNKEIAGGAIGDYGADTPAEGLAEFSRVVFGMGIDPAALRSRFPEVSKVFDAHGLLGEGTKPFEKPADIFKEAINNGPLHADTLKQDIALSASEPGEDRKDFISRAAKASAMSHLARTKGDMESARKYSQQFADIMSSAKEKFGKPLSQEEKAQGRVGGGQEAAPEASSVPQRITALKNAQVDAEREKRGDPPMMKAARLANPEVLDAAMKELDTDPEAGSRLVDELSKKNRATTVRENALLLQRKIALANEHERAMREHIAAFKPQAAERDAIELDRLEKRERDLSQKINELDKVTRDTGTEWGRAGQFRKQMAKEDFSLSNMQLQMEVAKGRPLTAEEKVALVGLHDKIETAGTKADAAEATAEAAPRPKSGQAALAAPEVKEMFSSKGEHEAAKGEFNDALAAARKANAGWSSYLADLLVKLRVNTVISSPITLAKIVAASAERILIAPLESAAGAVFSRLPGLRKIAAAAPREGRGFGASTEKQSFVAAFTKGLKDAWQTIRTGKSELDTLHGGKESVPREWLDYQFSLHDAMKAPAVRSEFTRSFLSRVDSALEKGQDATSPASLLRFGAEAYKDAQAAKFRQDNWLVDAYNRGINSLRQPGASLASRATGLGLKLLTPVVRIPTNLAFEVGTHIFGTGTGSVQAVRAWMRGIENLKPAEADSIMRQFKKGSLGGAAMLFGYLAPSMFGGYYSGKRDEDDVKAGGAKIGGVNIPSWLMHNPLLETIQFGATIRRAADKTVKGEKQGIGEGTAEGILGLASEIPLARESTEVAKGLSHSPGQRGAFFGELAKSFSVPQFVQWIAGKTDTDSSGETIKRKPQGVLQHVESGIPGLRNQLPTEEEAATERKAAAKEQRAAEPKPHKIGSRRHR